MMRIRRRAALFLGLSALLFYSCIGINAQADILADGSGTLVLDYRVSRMVDAMGKVGGQDRYLPLPVTREAFAALVASTPGITLQSFASTQDEVDIRIAARVRFDNPAALAALLSASGRKVGFARTAAQSTMSFNLSEGGGPLDGDLRRLVQAVFRDYRLELSVRTPTTPSSSNPGEVVAQDRAARVSVPIESLLSSRDPVVWTVTWRD